MPSNTQPRMLPIREAAAYLGATVWFVRNEVWNLRLPHIKFGNRLVFDRLDLDAYIERKKSTQ